MPDSHSEGRGSGGQAPCLEVSHRGGTPCRGDGSKEPRDRGQGEEVGQDKTEGSGKKGTGSYRAQVCTAQPAA